MMPNERRTRNLTVSLTLACACACGGEEATDMTATASGTWSISSPAFAEGGAIPLDNTCSGREFAMGTNPELNWTDGPAGTQSYALVLKHLAISDGLPPTDPNYFKGFMWAVWDIPATTRQIPANMGRAALPPELPGAQQWAIRNQFGYFAPCPNADPAVDPATHVTDEYGFTLYALNTPTLALPAKEADVSNYTLTLTKTLDAISIGKIQLKGTSNAVSAAAPMPVDMATLQFPAGVTP